MNRETARDLIWIAVLGLVVQGFWALRIDHPTYFDAYYYAVTGQQLAAGAGFTEPFIWQYLDNPEGVPKPSHTYWMPLTSIIAAAGYQISDTFRGAQLPFWLMAGLLPWLSYGISWRLSPARWQARTAALFTMAGGYYASYWVQPTTFVLFAWTAGGCLFALALAQARLDWRYWLLTGLLAGAAHLTRADGVLLILLAGLFWLLAFLRAWRGQKVPKAVGVFLPIAMALVAGYLLIMGPWFYRTWALSGTFLSTVGTETAFLTSYDDLFAYNRHFGLQAYLDWGWANILRSKLDALWLSLQTYVAVVGLTAFFFVAVVGWFGAGRSQPETERRVVRQFLAPFTWYALLLFLAMSVVFTFPGQRGSLLHSSTALWPWSMALAAAGIDTAVDWIASRRRRWRPHTAKRLFAATFVMFVFLISLFVSQGHPLRKEQARAYADVAEQLPRNTIVMSSEPPNFYYHTGILAVVVPNEPAEGVLEAAMRYGVEFILLDADSPRPLSGLYSGEEVPGIEFREEFGAGLRLYHVQPLIGAQQ